MEIKFERYSGASPSESKFYVLVMFDISNRKKYSLLTKLLKRYCRRVQNSVYESYLRQSDIRKLTEGVERLMESEKYFNPADRLRIYRMSGLCSAVVFGECADAFEDLLPNVFI